MTVPERFGRYRVAGRLGTGAMGEVYAATDDVLGRGVAVKTLRSGATGLGARILDERFRLEARAIAALTHPGIVQVFDIDLEAEPPYLVMERLVGPSLKERLAGGGRLDETALRALGIQIASALAAAHRQHIVHRDVKPANILLADAGDGASGARWKLADFGVAHVPDSSLTMTGQFVGSPAYAPPEALVRGELGPAGDVFGLGATLYEAAAGQWPRATATTGALLAPTPPVRELAPALSADLAAVIDQAVALEPGARPTATQLAEALARSVSAPGVAAVVALPMPAPRSAAAGWNRKATAIAGGIAVAAVLLALAMRSPSSTDAPAMRPAPGALDPGAALHVADPPMRGGKAGKDWDKVLGKLRKGELREARRKLGEWERKYGETPETRDLARQLEALPPEAWERGRDRRDRDDD